MFGFLFTYAKPLFIGVVILAVVGSYTSVFYLGKLSERKALVERTVEVLKERNKIDGELNSLDRTAFCARLGLVFEAASGKCV